MSTVFKYPDGRKAVTSRDRDEMPGRSWHFYAAFAHSWDFASFSDKAARDTQQNQAVQWFDAFTNQGGT